MANFRLPPPYTIIRHLGKGGIGEIYLAYHENLRKQVIVKKVKDHCVDIMDSRIEVDILKNLHHMIWSITVTDRCIFRKNSFCSGCSSFWKFWIIFIRENRQSCTATSNRQTL